MLLATRCPFCKTVFRLQPAQLASRRGLVRCGHCHEVFDASSSLFDITEGGDFSTAQPLSPAAATALVTGAPPPSASPNFSAEAWDPWAPAADAVIDVRLRHTAANLPLRQIAAGAGVAVTPRSSTEPELPASAFSASVPHDNEPRFAEAPLAPPAFDPEPSAEETPKVWHKAERAAEHPVNSFDEPALREPSLAYTRGIDSEPGFNGLAAPIPELFASYPEHESSNPFQVVRETLAAEPRRLGWIIAGSVLAALLIITLLAQLAWWQRETVMVAVPRSQTLYAQVCAQLGCQVAPPHDIDGLQVEPSDLRQIDGPHKLELKVPLRNRFAIALAYPAIELTLLDDQNNVAMRRVLWPQDYVAPGTPIAAGMPARTTQTMIVHLDTGNAVASNFRVQIFYP